MERALIRVRRSHPTTSLRVLAQQDDGGGCPGSEAAQSDAGPRVRSNGLIRGSDGEARPDLKGGRRGGASDRERLNGRWTATGLVSGMLCA
jgi:hypothetical protein